jgi:hypothetical protein
METRLDQKHHCIEKVACLIKYVDLIGYIGIFGSTLEAVNSISIIFVFPDSRFHYIMVHRVDMIDLYTRRNSSDKSFKYESMNIVSALCHPFL